MDEKNRLTLPRELRRRLGIESGSKLQLEQVGAQIIIKPAVPIKEPTESIWGLAARGSQPKSQEASARGDREEEEAGEVNA